MFDICKISEKCHFLWSEWGGNSRNAIESQKNKCKSTFENQCKYISYICVHPYFERRLEKLKEKGNFEKLSITYYFHFYQNFFLKKTKKEKSILIYIYRWRITESR